MDKQVRMNNVIGFGLAGGRGVRVRPLSLEAHGYLRSKAALLLLGRRMMDWLLDILKAEGMTDFVILTKGKENRYQIKSIVGYGEALGVRIRYSPVSLDHENCGSADAVLANLDYFAIRNTLFVFPTDSIIDIDLSAMLAEHKRHGAAVTIACARLPETAIAGRYGLVLADTMGRVKGFVEKPNLEQIHNLYGAGSPDIASQSLLDTNTGFYLMDPDVLREIIGHPEIRNMRRREFDIGQHLLPWMVNNNYPVYAHQIGHMGDIGNIPSYLETMLDILHGHFTLPQSILAQHYPNSREGLMIEPETLDLTDPTSGLTLTEKMARGLVTILPPVRIGKYVRIFPGVTLSECNIGDDAEIFANATIIRSSIGPGSLIGPSTHIEDSLLGFMVELRSTHEQPVSLTRYVAIGDEVIIRGGVTLSDGVLIHPRLKVPKGVEIPAHAEIENAEQMQEYL